ncbi:phage portal protein [Stenotrophomonas maltophilia]|uniref:phage portal protein n=1 Tax=Stenotrophomonas maltophilia group TaxID=995085 RepID=UPI0019D46AAE|nr:MULTISPECIES: phage portal protein [Stenotrophomonas maltophilia group]ELK6802928.1 phage portal protein [Stenotrophomonas maltophilia]MBN7828333.1 phage portal protein [Stenotrophomonas maltophilia]MBN7832324.1 phage portal protein [Stenotrophomonas maltophilia]MBN7856639.1 phage portal protein [Stenotrophomonas maltophilia]MBN7915851.1 phage portal protein [Stenotrophomonas maltophilia]
MAASLLDRVIGAISPQAALKRHRARATLDAVRAYEGASRTDGWRVRRAGASANADHLADARELRNRARALVQNVPYCARSLQVLVSATIGTGITPKAEGPNASALDILWGRWADVADADGKSDIYGLMATAYRAMEQDGEVMIRRRTRRQSDGLAVPLQLQVLEIDWLDGNKNGSASGGGQIINGIEYDAIGRIRGYWLFGAHPGEAVRGSVRLSSSLVPASDIIHLYNPVRPGQGRGITRFAPVIARVRDLMLYEDAELARKNLEARLGVIVSGDIDSMSNADDDGPSQLGSDRDQVTDLGPLPSGGVTHITGATAFQTVEPKPAGGYVEYCKFNAHIITAGIGVPYESATGDMREVNFSSARIRQMEFRRDCEQMQWLVLVPQMCKPIWRWFDEAAALGGGVRSTGSTADWSTPRWDYVNPKQDIESEIAAMGAGLNSPSEALRRRGYDPDAVYVEMGKDFKRMKETGALGLMTFLQSSGARTGLVDASTTNEE